MNEKDSSSKRKLSKGKTATLLVIVALAICGAVYWYINYQIPHQEAANAYNEAVQGLDNRNAELDAAISDLQGVQGSDVKPLDSSTDDAASAAIAQAQAAKQAAPEMPSDTNEIKTVAQQITSMGDYTAQLAAIGDAKQALQDSIDQHKQVTNPTDSFVVERLTGLPNVTGVEAATETNDPNGNLNKPGGYTAAVYFSSDLVDQSKTSASSGYTGIPAIGTDGGGCVEVYANEDDANKRNDYLAAFDGSVLASGSHEVLGTCLIRTSAHLTASQQATLTKTVEDSLIRLE